MVHWIERMMAELARYRDMLSDARDEQLLEAFGTAQLQREAFLSEPPRRKVEPAGDVDRGKALMDIFVGGIMADNIRRVSRMPELIKEKVIEKEDEATGEKKKLSLADKMAEDVRRDLEKLEAKRAERKAKKTGDGK
jgi:hypothetical protein